MQTIVFDMDNTLVDEFGATVRPGIVQVLTQLKQEKKILHLWTSSTKDRARQILKDHKLDSFFVSGLYREDYDRDNKGNRKDIRRVNADSIVDDDPAEITFAESIGKKGFLISPYRRNSKEDKEEIARLLKFLSQKSGFFARFS